MAAKKSKSKVTLTGKQVSALIACIAAIAVLSLMAGYISGKVFNKDTAEVEEEQEASGNVFSGMIPRFLDVDEVEKETTVDPKSADTFSFHTRLEKETAPANKPLPKSTTPVGSKKPEPSAAKKQAPPRTVKAARKSSKPKPAKRSVAESKNAKVKKLTIQVGSFKLRSEAYALVRKLSKKGYRAYVVPFKFKGETWSRVRVGVFDSAASAKKMARKLELEQKLPVLLVSYQSGK